MTDFHVDISISRDRIASALNDNHEQCAYVLAELSEYIRPGTYSFDDLCDGITSLEDEKQSSLRTFLERLINALPQTD